MIEKGKVGKGDRCLCTSCLSKDKEIQTGNCLIDETQEMKCINRVELLLFAESVADPVSCSDPYGILWRTECIAKGGRGSGFSP